MLKGDRSIVSVDHIARLFAKFGDPHCELSRVTDGCREEHVLDVAWEHDNGLFPNHSAFFITHVVNLVKDDPLDLTNNLASPIDHIPQDFSCHDKTGGALVNSHVPSNQSYISKLFLQLTILLVGKCLDRRSVDDSAVALQR